MDIRDYIASDKLMSLEPNHFLPAWNKSGLHTCDNDNGILFLAYYLRLCELLEHDFDLNDVSFDRLLSSLQVDNHKPGLLHRNPGRSETVNSHDNYCGIASICAQVNLPQHLEWTPDYALENHLSLNNKNPLSFSWFGVHQGHNWYVYYLGMNKRPPIIAVIWFMANLFVTAFSYKAYSNPSERMLTWLRTEIHDQKAPKLLPRWLVTTIDKFVWLYEYRTIKKFKMVHMHQVIAWCTAVYFRTDHPINVLARRL